MTADERARELWEQGTKRLSDGQVEEAVELFEQSIAVKPTAEGHTFRGWALSYLGRLDEATEECKQAIEIDPDFGNPYNDIGVYLMQKGQLDQAMPWLERATLAKRYEPRHFPYSNLGNIYERKGQWPGIRNKATVAREKKQEQEVACFSGAVRLGCNVPSKRAER